MTSESDHKHARVSFLAVPMTRLVAFVLNHRAMVFIIALLFAGASLYLSSNHLRFKNSRLDLINPDSEWNVYWKEYISKFGKAEDLYVVVDGDTPEDITQAMELLAAKVKARSDLFYSVFYKVDDSALFSKGLYRASDEEVQGLQLFLSSVQGVLRGQWESISLDRLMAESVMPLMAPPDALPEMVRKESQKHMERLVASLEGAFGPEYRYVTPWPELDVAARRNVQSTDILQDQDALDGHMGVTSFMPYFGGMPHLMADAPRGTLIADAMLEESPRPDSESPSHRNFPGGGTEILPFGSYMAHYPDFSVAEAPAATGRAYQDGPFPSYRPEHAQTAPTYPRIGSETPVTLPDMAGSMIQATAAQETDAEQVEMQPASAPTMGNNIHYCWLSRGKTAVLMAKLHVREDEKESFAQGSVGIDCLRGMMAEVRDEMRAEDGKDRVMVQLTGLPVIENDEMRSSEDGMSRATILAVVGITVLYIVFFGGLRHPILAMLALMFGIAWSMGFITLAVGHLNILSMSFGVILVGLGIDFGIHITTRYVECRRQGDDAYKGVIRAVYEVGPGVLTGGITTMVAFMMAAFTEFTGVKELGIIAGGGVLLCCLAAFIILPIFIFTSDKNRSADKLPVPRNPNRLLAFFQLRPGITVMVVIVLVAVLGYGVRYVEYDYNLLNLLPENLESVDLEHRLIAQTDQGSWYALSMSSDRDELLERLEKFRQLESVCKVEEILTIIPKENPKRTATIAAIHASLAHLPKDVRPVINTQRVLSATTNEEMDEELRLNSISDSFVQMLTFLKSKAEYRTLYQRVEKLYGEFCNMEIKTAYLPRVERFQQQLGQDLLAHLNTIRSISNPEPPKLSEIQPELLDRFMAVDPVTGEATYLLKVFGKGDIWDMDNLEKFVSQVREVDPHATGNPLQTYECSLQMQKCYIEAAVYALAAVMFFLYLDLRSIRQTVLALFPVGLGMLQMFGIMGYLGISLNAANMIVLPLIIGIGIDDGIHVMHDFRHQHKKGFYRLTPSTCTSVLLTSFTTIMGFGTLMIASHRGLQSLGLVLSLGIFCCMYTSILILPAMLSLFCRFAEDGMAVETREDEEKLITQRVLHAYDPSSGHPAAAYSVETSRTHWTVENPPEEKPQPAPRLPSEVFRTATSQMTEQTPRPAHTPTVFAAALGEHTEPIHAQREQKQPVDAASVRISRYITTPNGEVIHSTSAPAASPLISSLLPDKRAA